VSFGKVPFGKMSGYRYPKSWILNVHRNVHAWIMKIDR
jgi:hypothetical protein